MERYRPPTKLICFLCGGSSEGDNQSREHIIQAALGGWKTVTGFICRTCNSETGHSWDEALAADLEDLNRLLNISRQRGSVRPKTVRTSDGTPVRILPGNQIELAHQYTTDFEDGNRKIRRLTARSVDELRDMASKTIDRQGLSLDVETLITGASSRTRYLQEALPHTIGTGRVYGERSLVKSALALMFEAGIDPNVADAATAYLTRDEAPTCVFPYYKADLVSPRTRGMPLNCVYVRGDQASGTLLAYIEIFGFLRRVIRLSDKYDGEAFEHCYVMDPTDGAEQQVSINLDPTAVLEAELDPDPIQENQACVEVLRHLIEKALEKAEQKVMEDLYEKTVSAWCDQHGKQPGDELTVEEAHSFSGRVAEVLAPYLLHRLLPAYLPEYALEELARAKTPNGQNE